MTKFRNSSISGSESVSIEADTKQHIAELEFINKEAIAKKVIEEADSRGIPLYQYPDLTNLLYRLELDQSIPVEIHQIMSEILDWIFELKQVRDNEQKIADWHD